MYLASKLRNNPDIPEGSPIDQKKNDATVNPFNNYVMRLVPGTNSFLAYDNFSLPIITSDGNDIEDTKLMTFQNFNLLSGYCFLKGKDCYWCMLGILYRWFIF